MKAIFSNKIINAIVLVALLPYILAGLSSVAHADNKSAFKDAIGKEYQVAEAKSNEVKSGEIRAADAMTKAPLDADFKKLDTNGDGKISLKEAVKDKNLALQFDATDVNHDGMIAADEYAAFKTTLSMKGTEAVTPVTN